MVGGRGWSLEKNIKNSELGGKNEKGERKKEENYLKTGEKALKIVMRIKHFFPRIRIRLSWEWEWQLCSDSTASMLGEKNPDPTLNRNEAKNMSIF